MEKITFAKSVSVEFVKKEVCDFFEFEGEGVYKIVRSSRNEVIDFEKVSSDNTFMLRNEEEIIDSLYIEDEDELEYYNEFVYSGSDDYMGEEVYVETLGEEDSFEFYYVK